jgi:hypothetical protein
MTGVRLPKWLTPATVAALIIGGAAPSAPAGAADESDRCTASQNMFVGSGQLGNPNGAWYSTLTSNEAFDSLRTHRFLNTCTIEEIIKAPPGYARVEQRVLHGFPDGYTTLTRNRNELFVFYGTTGNSTCTDEAHQSGQCTFGPMTAKIDANTFTVIWKALLFNAQNTWDYPGGVGVHANGFLYTITENRAFKQDPVTGEILTTTMLPTPNNNGQTPEDTVYNGFIVLSDGKLVTKQMTRKQGCTLQGVQALSSCVDYSIPAYITVLDPDALTILTTIAAPQTSIGRITSAVFNDNEYVYLVGALPSDPDADEPKDYTPSRVYRFFYDRIAKAVTLDAAFTPVPYIRSIGQKPGTAVAVMDDFAVVQTNFTLRAEHDLGLTVYSQTDGHVEAYVEPFSGYPSDTLLAIESRSISSQLSLPTVDPEKLQIFSWDADKGRFAGLQFDPKGHTLTTMWNVRQESNAFANLVGPARNRQIVLTNQVYVPSPKLVPNCSKLADQLAECEQLVWRDSQTGSLLLQSGLQAGGFGAAIGVGFNGRFYTVTNKGDFIEHTVRGRTR